MDPHNSGSRGDTPRGGSGEGPDGGQYYGADQYGANQYGADQYGADQYGADQYGQYGGAEYDEAAYANADYADGDYEYDPAEGYAAPPPRRRGKRGRLRRRKKLIAAIGALVLLGGGALVSWGYVNSIAVPDQLTLPERSTIYYADGTTVMASLGRQNRTIIRVDALPDPVKSAVVAAEDLNFWKGSRTNISRQYVRLSGDIKERSTLSNARVVIMAGKLEDKYTKDDILGFYLNTVYFGRGAYGIEAGAQAYFGKPAAGLTAEEAMVLAAVIRSPDDGRYDPTVNQAAAQERWQEIRAGLVKLGTVTEAAAAAMVLPTTVVKYDPAAAAVTGLDKPTGLVVRHVLSELRQRPAFAGKPPGFLENGGFRIVTTVDPKAQALLEKTTDETVKDSAMFGQPANLQAAAAVVEPGTGRVLAYYGGHLGTGSDFAGWYYDDDNSPTGYGAHQPGGTFEVYALAAALKDGISLKSYWNARSPQEFPQSGRTGKAAVRNSGTAKCQPACTLLDATTASLDTVYFGLTETLGPGPVLEMARAAGIDDIWAFVNANDKERIDIRVPVDVTTVVPAKITTEIGIGQFPVTVLDQANSMATFASGGRRAGAHFVREVRHQDQVVYSESLPASDAPRVLSQASLDDLNFTLSQTSAGKLSGRSSASKTGTWRSGASSTDTAHAWIVGYTPSLAMAVWVGNKAEERPLRTATGSPVFGSGLPATMYRTFMNAAHTELKFKKVTFPAPKYIGDDSRGNTPGPG